MFKGVVVAFETMTPFPGLLVAVRRAGTVSKFFRDMFGTGGLEEVQCGVASLDEAYEFRTDNAGAARPLVSGRLAKALQWLGETWPGEPARVALEGRDGFLLLPVTKNFFELPGISTPLDYKAHIEPIVADMVALLATASLVRKIGQPDDVGRTGAEVSAGSSSYGMGPRVKPEDDGRGGSGETVQRHFAASAARRSAGRRRRAVGRVDAGAAGARPVGAEERRPHRRHRRQAAGAGAAEAATGIRSRRCPGCRRAA